MKQTQTFDAWQLRRQFCPQRYHGLDAQQGLQTQQNPEYMKAQLSRVQQKAMRGHKGGEKGIEGGPGRKGGRQREKEGDKMNMKEVEGDQWAQLMRSQTSMENKTRGQKPDCCFLAWKQEPSGQDQQHACVPNKTYP